MSEHPANFLLPVSSLQIFAKLANGMQALTFVPEDKPELVDMFARWSIAYSKVLMCHLREDGNVQMELQVSSLPISLCLLLVHAP